MLYEISHTHTGNCIWKLNLLGCNKQAEFKLKFKEISFSKYLLQLDSLLNLPSHLLWCQPVAICFSLLNTVENYYGEINVESTSQ